MRGSFPIGRAQAIPSFSHETVPSGVCHLCSDQRACQCNAEVTTICARLLNAVVLVPADRANPVKDLPTSFIRLHPDSRSTDEGLSEKEFRSSLARWDGLALYRICVMGVFPKKPGTRNRMNLQAGGDRVRDLG